MFLIDLEQTLAFFAHNGLIQCIPITEDGLNQVAIKDVNCSVAFGPSSERLIDLANYYASIR